MRMSTHSWLDLQTPPIPENDVERVNELRRYVPEGEQIPYDQAIENLTRLASDFFKVPSVFVNLIDDYKLFQHACFGQEKVVVNRTDSFCQFTIMQDDIFEVFDTHQDSLFQSNPYVTGNMQIRYYVGAPLKTPNGYNIGSLCLIDHKPNALTASQKTSLKIFADEVVSRMELNLLNKKLHKENNAKDELMRIVSHDMRNPLMGIVGFAEYLASETNDEEKKEIYGIMEDAGKHMLGIVNVLLNSDYLRNETFALNRVMVDAIALTQEVIVLNKPFARLKEQEILTDFPTELFFKLDAERWKQIVGNLLRNAIKFTPRKGHISLSLKLNALSDKSLILHIEDSGIGMNNVQKSELFSGETSHHRMGTDGEETSGLGMVLIKKYVELHRGTLAFESELGQGTTFTITIPE